MAGRVAMATEGVRSPGCCSAGVGTHYATSHLSISARLVLLLQKISLVPPLPPFPCFLLSDQGPVAVEEAVGEMKDVGPDDEGRHVKRSRLRRAGAAVQAWQILDKKINRVELWMWKKTFVRRSAMCGYVGRVLILIVK